MFERDQSDCCFQEDTAVAQNHGGEKQVESGNIFKAESKENSLLMSVWSEGSGMTPRFLA